MPAPSPTSIATYGGALSDYVVSVTDGTTDRAAAAMNQALCDLAMTTNVAPRAVVTLTTANTLNPALTKHAA